MTPTTSIFLIIIVILILSIIVIFVAFKTSKPANKQIKPVQVPEVITQESPYPKCIQDSYDAKRVFGLLQSINMIKKYNRLFDTYSIVTCQKRDFDASCDKTSMTERINTLKSWGADENDRNASNIVNSVTHVTNQLIGTFLTLACSLCEKQVTLIANDDDIPKEVKTQIVGLNSEFYRTQFDTINKQCI